MLRLVAATLTVALTTADDAVWLVPYVASNRLAIQHRIIHAFLFVGTLESMVLLCVLTAETIRSFVTNDYILGAIGATLCWSIALFLYIKKMLKKRRRDIQQAEAPLNNNSSLDDGSSYGSVPQRAPDFSDDANMRDERGVSLSPWTVVSLTFLGALDEVSYFPSLLLGKVFSPFDLCLGTLLAACLVLSVVTLFLSRCQPLLNWLDRIPLYAVLFVFATILTVDVIVDYLQDRIV
jgi:cadmium resistance protein CadD (predicted permease)